jgi:hypothetical protein
MCIDQIAKARLGMFTDIRVAKSPEMQQFP